MKRLQKGYGKFLSSDRRDFAPHTLVIVDPDPRFSAVDLFDAGPGDLLMASWPPEISGAQEAFGAFLARVLEKPSMENVVILDVSPAALSPDEGPLRDRGVLRFEALRRMPSIQYAQVTRGLRILLLYFSVETGELEVFEHGTWEPFLSKEPWGGGL
jgi:hypothetical protein